MLPADPIRSRTRAAALSLVALATATLLLGAAGCGRRPERADSLRFEDLSDTSGLTRGKPILTSFEPYRLNGGAMRLRGTADLPDGTRLQVSIVRRATEETVLIVQATVEKRGFETAPLMGPRGPLPEDLYRFEVLAYFNPAWQPERVLRATREGRSLRGPGVIRGRNGQPAFYLREERRL